MQVSILDRLMSRGQNQGLRRPRTFLRYEDNNWVGVEAAKKPNHLTQHFFLLEIQPSDENIRGLQMVHHVCWSEMVGLGEVVSPCNSDPNRFIRVLLYFDGHLITSG